MICSLTQLFFKSLTPIAKDSTLLSIKVNFQQTTGDLVQNRVLHRVSVKHRTTRGPVGEVTEAGEVEGPMV